MKTNRIQSVHSTQGSYSMSSGSAAKTAKVAKTLSLDASTVDYVDATKGEESASERVNELLQCAIMMERYAKLDQEAEQFFRNVSQEERLEAEAFESASIEAMIKD